MLMIEKYSDGVLDLKFENLSDALQETKIDLIDHVDTQFASTMLSLNRIEGQTTKTNGRVNLLEKEAGVANGKWQFLLGCVSTLTLIVLPFMGFVVYQVIEHGDAIGRINQSLDI